MGGTYKKKQRAEKAKVKLKGAKLPKGLNVTKTDFKVRKIIIRDQLKEAQYVEGQRQINLKETLSRLKHHSGTYRVEALKTLREALLHKNTDILCKLSELMQSIAALSLDMEKETRRESFKTLGSLLSSLTTEAAEPFFHVISSYLRCAMTHIQTGIQEDALLMLDVLLKHVPQLLAAHSEKIFKNFLEMISRVRAEGDRAGRTLTINMGQKQTTVKWRSKVLQRLAQMLQTQATYKRNHANLTNSKAQGYQMRTFNVKEPQHYALKRAYGAQQLCNVTSIFTRSLNDLITDNTNSIDTTLRSSIEHLMPLLLEAWLEVRPRQDVAATAQNILSQDAAQTLQIVLQIIAELWNLINIHIAEMNSNDLLIWFQQEYADSFANNFILDTFPYEQVEQKATETASKRSKKSSLPLPVDEQLCLQQNIRLSHLMGRFYGKRFNHKLTNKFLMLIKYLQQIVSSLKTHDAENYAHLDQALRAYLHDCARELLHLDSVTAAELRALLNATIAAFLHNQFPHKEGIAGRVLLLLCDIVQQQDLVDLYGVSKQFEAFLQYLPQLLLKPMISEMALTAMSHLGKQKNAIFLNGLTQVLLPTIENMQKIQVTGASNAFEGKKLIMNLFYWTEKSVSNAERLKLIQKVEENIIDKRIVAYYKFILMQ